MFSRIISSAKKVFLPSTENMNPDKGGESGEVKIEVHYPVGHPTKAWQKIRVKQKQSKIKPLPIDTPVYEDKVRFVCMSDTHNRTSRMPAGSIPQGDVFLHAGDFTMTGKMPEVEEFNNFLGTLPHTHKIVIAGNHDLTFDDNFLVSGLERFGYDSGIVTEYLKSKGVERVSDLLTNCTYIQDAEVIVAGIRIYGSPWQPEFGDWGFNLHRGEPCLEKWNYIPEGIDILMTHGPPIGYGDLCVNNINAGCVELLSTIQKRVKPKYHIFGHIHEAYGVTTDGQTIFINASTCSLRYRPDNPPVIFDIPLLEGYSKKDIVIKQSRMEKKPLGDILSEASASRDEAMNYSSSDDSFEYEISGGADEHSTKRENSSDDDFIVFMDTGENSTK